MTFVAYKGDLPDGVRREWATREVDVHNEDTVKTVAIVDAQGDVVGRYNVAGGCGFLMGIDVLGIRWWTTQQAEYVRGIHEKDLVPDPGDPSFLDRELRDWLALRQVPFKEIAAPRAQPVPSPYSQFEPETDKDGTVVSHKCTKRSTYVPGGVRGGLDFKDLMALFGTPRHPPQGDNL